MSNEKEILVDKLHLTVPISFSNLMGALQEALDGADWKHTIFLIKKMIEDMTSSLNYEDVDVIDSIRGELADINKSVYELATMIDKKVRNT